jgi:hypothetical protein
MAAKAFIAVDGLGAVPTSIQIGCSVVTTLGLPLCEPLQLTLCSFEGQRQITSEDFSWNGSNLL